MRWHSESMVFRLALFMPIPFLPFALLLANPDRSVLIPISVSWLLVVAMCVAAAPIAGLGRIEAFTLAILGVCFTLVGGYLSIIAAFFSLCTHDVATFLVAITAGVLAYLAASAIALHASVPIKRLVGFPLAITGGFLLMLLTLALLTGGPHYCYT